MSVTQVRRTTAVAGLVLAAALLAGCGDDDSGTGAVSSENAGSGVSCNGFPIAEPLSAETIVGEWYYQESHLYEDGQDYYADARGMLAIAADGTWSGERSIVTGGGTGNYPTAYGPGTWSFDTRTLTLSYDDGSDAETYTGVRVSDQVDENGQAIQALTLEYAEGASCTTYLLYGQR